MASRPSQNEVIFQLKACRDQESKWNNFLNFKPHKWPHPHDGQYELYSHKWRADQKHSRWFIDLDISSPIMRAHQSRGGNTRDAVAYEGLSLTSAGCTVRLSNLSQNYMYKVTYVWVWIEILDFQPPKNWRQSAVSNCTRDLDQDQNHGHIYLKGTFKGTLRATVSMN